MKYYYIETSSSFRSNWQLLKNVSTVAGAKVAATRRQLFQGTTLRLGILTTDKDVDAEPAVFCIKRADEIDMARPGRWKNIDIMGHGS